MEKLLKIVSEFGEEMGLQVTVSRPTSRERVSEDTTCTHLYDVESSNLSIKGFLDRVPTENNEVRYGISEQDGITVPALCPSDAKSFPCQITSSHFFSSQVSFSISTPPCILRDCVIISLEARYPFRDSEGKVELLLYRKAAPKEELSKHTITIQC